MTWPQITLSFEKALLLILLGVVLCVVLLMAQFIPQQSAALVIMAFLAGYASLLTMALIHHRRRVHPLPPSTTPYQPSVCIIVPAHNEACVIAETLENLMTIEYPNKTLWVIDDRSTDGTPTVLARLASQYPGQFEVVTRPPDATPGKSAVLNDAMGLTQGEILVVFDADARVQPDFLTRTLPYLADPNVGAVQVRKSILNHTVNFLTRCQYHEYMLDAQFQSGRDAIQGAVELRGNGQLVKREALLMVEGWSEETITDDLDLSTKLHITGWDIRFVGHVVVQEEGILAFRPLLRQRRRWAEGSLKRYLEYTVDILTSTTVSHRTRSDMWAYFIQFILPLWIAMDVLVQSANYFGGFFPSHWLSSIVVFPLLALFFISGLFGAIRHFEKASLGRSLWGAVETSLFLSVIWVPVVIWIAFKVVVTPDTGPLSWGKTEHLGTQAFVKPSRLKRVKNFLRRTTQVLQR